MAPADENDVADAHHRFQTPGSAAVRYRAAPAPRAVRGPLDTLPIGKPRCVAGRAHRVARVRCDRAGGEKVGENSGSRRQHAFVKPLDCALVLELAQTHEGFVT